MSTENRETDAIVLDCFDHGESDKIVTIFSKDHGRITGIAKGANRSKKRFVNKLELFSHITMGFNERQRSSLVFIAEAELNNSFIELRSHIDRYITASFIRETLLIATTEREEDREIFKLLLWSLQAIDEGREPLGVTIIFLLRLFERLGYQPALADCRGCAAPFTLAGKYLFHHMAGGLICEDCAADSAPSSTVLSTGTIRIMQSAMTEPFERLHRLHFSRQARRQALTMLHRYGRSLFQREIHSWKAMRGLIG
jgi:DNA repair protein RecO (recombination protein O)